MYLCFISFEKSIVHKIKTLSPNDALCKFVEFGTYLRRRKFFYVVKSFSLFRLNLPLEKGVAPYLNKLKFPLPKDALGLIYLKLAQWFWIGRFLNVVNVFSLLSPLEKCVAITAFFSNVPTLVDI